MFMMYIVRAWRTQQRQKNAFFQIGLQMFVRALWAHELIHRIVFDLIRSSSFSFYFAHHIVRAQGKEK